MWNAGGGGYAGGWFIVFLFISFLCEVVVGEGGFNLWKFRCLMSVSRLFFLIACVSSLGDSCVMGARFFVLDMAAAHLYLFGLGELRRVSLVNGGRLEDQFRMKTGCVGFDGVVGDEIG